MFLSAPVINPDNAVAPDSEQAADRARRDICEKSEAVIRRLVNLFNRRQNPKRGVPNRVVKPLVEIEERFAPNKYPPVRVTDGDIAFAQAETQRGRT